MKAGGNILVSSAGRRVGLLGCIRDSLAARDDGSRVLAIDCATSAPAAFFADRAFPVPECSDPSFADTVLRICIENGVTLLIPTIDPELPVYAAASGTFDACGIVIAISTPAVVNICGNKIATHQWLVSHGFPTVRQTDVRSALENSGDWPLPLIAKPFNGSASNGVRRIQTRIELQALMRTTETCIVQEIAAGREFTINVYVDRQGVCISAVPHWRMEVRAGEVSKGITVKNRKLIDLARSVAEALPGARGPMNIQCFMDEAGGVRIIEINARFGGGYPLAHRAGARFTDWLLEEREGKRLPYREDWTDDLAMLRFDEAVFLSGDRIRTWCAELAQSSI